MSNIISFSTTPDIEEWLDKNYGNRQISSFVSNLIKKEIERQNSHNIEKLLKEKKVCEDRMKEIDDAIRHLNEDKEKLRQEEMEKNKQKEENEKNEKEKKMKLYASLKGMDKIIGEYEKLGNKEDMTWAGNKVDELRKLNPENERKIGSVDLMKFLRSKYLSNQLINN
jgi:septal ring factor EnvC (AmiA/AmiB activator)